MNNSDCKTRSSDDELNFYDPNYCPKKESSSEDPGIFDSPKSIYEYLDSHVYSHALYKKALALFIWKHINGHKSGALLVAGSSGSGKTEMIRALSRIYKNIHVADGASLVPTGFKGNTSLATHLSSLDFLDEKHPPVLVIDEFDKLVFRSKSYSWNDTGLIAELLKFIEGGSFNVGNTDNPKYIDTTGLGVILLGSFSALSEHPSSIPIGFSADIRPKSSVNKPLKQEQIIEQFPAELQGRISSIVILDELTEDDFYNLLKDDRYSPISRLCRDYGLNMTVSEEKCHEIAHDAFVSRTGVRKMNSIVSAYLDEQLFSDHTIKEVSIE